MARHTITHPINESNGMITSNPREPKVFAIKQKIPIGANFIIKPVISIKSLLNSSKKGLICLVSSLNFVKNIPISAAKIIIGTISPLANDSMTFSGIVLNNVSANVWLMVALLTDSELVKVKPKPGCNMFDIIIAIITAIAVVIR